MSASAFKEVARQLARDTKDSELDQTLDLDIAQASHVLKVLREIAAEHPIAVTKALKLHQELVVKAKGKGKKKKFYLMDMTETEKAKINEGYPE